MSFSFSSIKPSGCFAMVTHIHRAGAAVI